jgi:hypothetical protein
MRNVNPCFRYFVAGFLALLLSSVALFAGTSGFSAPRPVNLSSDPSMTVTFTKEFAVTNDDGSLGVVFPAGIYTYEASDAKFLYFRAPAAVTIKSFENGVCDDQRVVPGGLMLSIRAPGSACAYVDSPKAWQKVMALQLSGEFLRNRGVIWKPSF